MLARGALVLLVALAWRSAHLLWLLDSEAGRVLVQDARHYHETALRSLEGSAGPEAGPSFANPGYPYVVAQIYALLGPRPAATLWLQALAGACTSVLVMGIARSLLRDDRAALIAGLTYAVYAGALFYDGLLLVPSLVNFLLALAWLAALDPSEPGRAVLAGAALGAAALLRPNALIFVAGAALLLLWPGAGTLGPSAFGDRVRRALLLAAASIAVVLPPIVFEAVRSGAWVPIAANAGVNFWIGNHRSAEGIYHAAPFVERLDIAGEREGFLEEGRRRSGDPAMGLAEADRFWFREAIAEIRALPGRALRIAGRKLALFVNAVEAKTNVGLAFHERLSPVLARASLPWAWLAIAGSAGIALLVLERNRAALHWIALVIAVPLLTCVAFFVSGEYRHPASLALCIASAVPLAHLVTRARVPMLHALTAGIVAACMAVAVLHRFPPLERTVDPRLDFANHARSAVVPILEGVVTTKDYARARAILEEAGARVESDPFLLDARLMIDCSEALTTREPQDVARARATAERLRALDLRASVELPAEFVEASADSVRRCLTALARL